MKAGRWLEEEQFEQTEFFPAAEVGKCNHIHRLTTIPGFVANICQNYN